MPFSPNADHDALLQRVRERVAAGSEPPLQGERFTSTDEVIWIMEQVQWSSAETLPEGFKRPDFRAATLLHLNMNGFSLRYANFAGATFFAVSFENAILEWADFTEAKLQNVSFQKGRLQRSRFQRAQMRGVNLCEARLMHAQFQETDLRDARFSGDGAAANATNAIFDQAIMTNCQANGVIFTKASFVEADLTRAQLSDAALQRADLSGCDLTDAQLQGANLQGAVMSDQTELPKKFIGQNTRLVDIHWNNVPLSGIEAEDWPQIVFDESVIQPHLERYPRVLALRNAERAYRGLAQTLRAQGMVDLASRYRRREKLIAGRALGANRQYAQQFGGWLLHIITGYGESIFTILRSYIITIIAFTFVYYVILNGGIASFQGTTVIDALVFSVTSFHGRGFFSAFSVNVTPHDPIAIIAMVEAVLGLFIEVTLIAAFSRRFLES